MLSSRYHYQINVCDFYMFEHFNVICTVKVCAVIENCSTSSFQVVCFLEIVKNYGYF